MREKGIDYFENSRTGLIWERMGRSTYVRTGLRRAGFDGAWLTPG